SVCVSRMALTVGPRRLTRSTISSGSRLASITTASRVPSSSTRYELVPNCRSAVTSTWIRDCCSDTGLSPLWAVIHGLLQSNELLLDRLERHRHTVPRAQGDQGLRLRLPPRQSPERVAPRDSGQ